jgi:AcrR family transcriptional regulator
MSEPSPRADAPPARGRPASPASARRRRPGLRERKKLKTRIALQEHALRLFREQGYAQTTVEQIADAAEVSPSTFFRYFPTKEDVVLFDVLDPLFIAAYRRQPADLGPLEAMRRVLPEVFAALTPEQIEEQRLRGQLVIAEPALQAAWVVDIIRTGNIMAELIAERSGLPAQDERVRIYTGAVMGAMMGAMVPVLADPEAGFVAAIERALEMLEGGLRL